MLTPSILLWDLIQERVHLTSSTNGWMSARCSVCNDHSDRCGFIHDQSHTGFKCFNCGSKFKYEENTGKFSRETRNILADFGISRIDLEKISSSLFFNHTKKSDKEVTLESLSKINLHTPEVSFPDRTMKLGIDGYDSFQEPIIEYLLNRNMDPLNFYFSLDPKLLRRAIIPFWRAGKLIYWQSRSIDQNVKPRYKNCTAGIGAVIFGYDRLFTYSDAPLFVTEGAFDAEPIQGVCILGSSLNQAKKEILHKTRRRIIFVIDRDSNGGALGNDVIEQGWELTFVDPRAKDVNDSIQKFGKLFTVFSLINNASNKISKIESKMVLDLGLLQAKMRKPRYV